MVADWEPLLSSLTRFPVHVSKIRIRVPLSLAVAKRVPWMFSVMQLRLETQRKLWLAQWWVPLHFKWRAFRSVPAAYFWNSFRSVPRIFQWNSFRSRSVPHCKKSFPFQNVPKFLEPFQLFWRAYYFLILFDLFPTTNVANLVGNCWLSIWICHGYGFFLEKMFTWGLV